MNDDIDHKIEVAIYELYSSFYQLRKSKQYQREYDIMGTLITMLSEDRAWLRENKKEFINE